MKSVDGLKDLLHNLDIWVRSIWKWVKPTSKSITTPSANEIVLNWNAAQLFCDLLKVQQFLQGRFPLSVKLVVSSYGRVHHENKLVS